MYDWYPAVGWADAEVELVQLCWLQMLYIICVMVWYRFWNSNDTDRKRCACCLWASYVWQLHGVFNDRMGTIRFERASHSKLLSYRTAYLLASASLVYVAEWLSQIHSVPALGPLQLQTFWLWGTWLCRDRRRDTFRVWQKYRDMMSW